MWLFDIGFKWPDLFFFVIPSLSSAFDEAANLIILNTSVEVFTLELRGLWESYFFLIFYTELTVKIYQGETHYLANHMFKSNPQFTIYNNVFNEDWENAVEWTGKVRD